MSKTLEYTIVSDGNTVVMADKINALLLQGWTLYGGLCFQWKDSNSFKYAQALTKEVDLRGPYD